MILLTKKGKQKWTLFAQDAKPAIRRGSIAENAVPY